MPSRGTTPARAMTLSSVSRDRARLQETSERLTADHRVLVEILPADLSMREGTDLVAQRLSEPGRAVDVLVNNAGFGVNKPFAKSTVDEEQRLLDVLVVAVMRLTHTALRAMLERGRGDIINVSSTAGFTSRGSYSAHKAWVTSFTRALSFRYRADGIRIMALCPGFVHTEFHQRMGASMERMPDWMWLEADQGSRPPPGTSRGERPYRSRLAATRRSRVSRG